MERESTSEEPHWLSADDLCPKTAYGDLDVSGLARVRKRGWRAGLLDLSFAGQVGGAAPLPSLETTFSSQGPGAVQPGPFFDTPQCLPLYNDPRRKNPLPTDVDAGQFHDSELGDVYDLYNACNGVIREDGLLDVRKLKELSAEEKAVLNVSRLKEVWEHTATTHCPICARIVRTLNEVRQANASLDRTQR